MNTKLYIVLLCKIFIIIFYIYWYYIRPRHYEKLYQKLKSLIQFKGFKHSHVTNQPEEVSQSKPLSHTNCHVNLWY